MALIISSFAKPLYMLLMLWGHQKMFALVLDIFVLTSNVAAMRGWFHSCWYSTAHPPSQLAYIALLGDNNQSFLAVGIGHGVRTLLKGRTSLSPYLLLSTTHNGLFLRSSTVVWSNLLSIVNMWCRTFCYRSDLNSYNPSPILTFHDCVFGCSFLFLSGLFLIIFIALDLPSCDEEGMYVERLRCRVNPLGPIHSPHLVCPTSKLA